MAAGKTIYGTKRNEGVTSGTYEIGFRKDNGTWQVMDELTVIIPSQRKADLMIYISGEETDE